MGVHARIGLLNRAEIHDEIDRLIALLDAADAPFEDLESDQDFGIEDQPEGEGDFGQGLLPTLPIYAIDQSAGPVNKMAARRAHDRRSIQF